MTRTSPTVAFGLYALTTKLDSTPTCSDVQPFSKVTDLRTGNVSSRPYITYEQDFWLLDGGYKFKPVNNAIVHVGLMSLSMSGADGIFSVPPVLTVTFGTTHDTDGLTLRFSQYSVDFSNNIQVDFYNAADDLIRSDTYSPTTWDFSTGQAMTGFKKITITFNGTNKPYRYLRLTGIDFGKLTYFTGADIKSASMVEEINPISIEIPGNSFEVQLFSTDAQFSIINPAGDYSELQNKQPLDVYEDVGTNTIYMGQYYLDTWENVSNNEILFRCIDRIGILGTLPYLGNLWTTAVNLEDVIDALMTAINTPYELDADLYGTEITGWIPVSNYREALQQIAFACGAYVTCARGGLVQIKKTVLASDLTTYENTITKADKSIDQCLTLKTLVTGVELTAHNYIVNTDVTELYNGYLAVGTHTITFNAPQHNLSITGGTITESGANYAIVTVGTAGTVVLSGEGYTDTYQIYGVYNTTLDANIPRNVLSIADATLISTANVATIAQRVYDYYQQRYLQKVKLYAPAAQPGGSVLVDTLYDRQIGGIVEKMATDLKSGFTSRVEITGVVIE